MSESTTSVDDPNKSDTSAGSTTASDPNTGTDNQPAKDGDNLDASKSTDDTSAGGDKSADDKSGSDKGTDDKSGADDAPASVKLDDDLDDWIEKRKLPKPTNDEERAAYQAQRDEQREFTRERQAKKDAADFGKAIDDAKPTTDKPDADDDDDKDPLEKRLDEQDALFKQERTARLQSEFYVDNKVSPEQGKAMVEIAREKFNAPATDAGKQRAFELWSSVDALPDLLDLAKARLAQADSSVVADEAARKEREKIERESNAKSPGRSASQHTPSGDGNITSDEARRKRFEARYNKS